MSLFGAMTTAVSGLSAQSTAFGNISDNVANSQTTGFKAIDTNFIDYLTTSTSQMNEPGAVGTRPGYTNSVQGSISQSNDPLALAISGQGMFAVSEQNGVIAGSDLPTFNQQAFYTRAGDFALDKNSYLVNSADEYLQGWSVNPTTGVVNQSQLAPIQITQTQFNPVATSTIDLSANLPSTPAPNTPVSSQVDLYDSLGNLHTMTLDWAQNASSDWTVTISSPDNVPPVLGTADVKFGPTASGNPVSSGTIGGFGAVTGNVTGSAYATNTPATLTLGADFGSGAQTISLNLGTFGQANGVTQFAGTTYTLRNLSQNGVAPGSFTGLSMTASGNVVANYNNGQSQTVAQVPIITFASPDDLQRQSGQAFTATSASGSAIAQSENTNGAGSLVTGSVEGSNVDIATEFSKLIIAQQAYSANAKMVTTADNMLQTTINMKQ